MGKPRGSFGGPSVSLITALVCVLSGCSLAPHYHPPAAAVPVQFIEAKAPLFASGAAPASALWHSFADPALDRLIVIALTNNKTLAQVRAQVNEARALRGLEFYALLPTVTGSASRMRSSPSARDPFVPPTIGKTTVFKAGFDASWELDVFGGARSADRAARAQQAAAEASLDAARQSVIAEVAQAYFGLRAQQERLRLQRRSVQNLQESLRVLQARRDAGRGTDLDVERARALALSTDARVPQIEAVATQNEQRLAVLTALPIDALRQELGPPKPLPRMPQMITVGAPADWLQRRPDVRVAERRLAAQTALVGVEAADFLPHLTLVGGFGWTAQLANDIGRSVAQRSQFGPALSWSFLDVGRVRQHVLASRARAAGALATYEDTVLRALEETEDALAYYRTANEAAVTLAEAAQAARTALDLAQKRFDAGASDTLTVLDAERTELDLQDQLASAELQRATALAALYKALVGDFAKSASNGATP